MALIDPAIRILHLSDFHMGKDAHGQATLLKNLLAHIAERARTAAPDLVLFTGDIANRAKREEYEAFIVQFLRPLKQQLPDAAVFMVPGNHDVDREVNAVVHRYDVLEKFPRFFDPTEEGQRIRQPFLPRFETYITSLAGDTPSGWISDSLGSYSQVLTLQGYRLGLLLLNTALLSGGDKDKHQLRLGVSTVETGLQSLEGADVILVLGHHPLSWLHEDEQEVISAVFGKRKVVYLCGHVHKGKGQRFDGAGEDFLMLAAGAAFQARDDEQWINGFQWYELDLRQSKLLVEPFSWHPSSREWRLNTQAFPNSRLVAGRQDLWFFRLPGDPDRLEPLPNYPSQSIQLLAEALARLEQELEQVVSSGRDDAEIRAKIRECKRELREGGRCQSGDVLQGRYALLDPLGQGGFAKVWKAYDRKLQKLVAVKILHGQFGEDRSHKERFFRGARLMGDLGHPGVVKVVQSEGDDEGFHFFVMNYCAGGNLHQYVTAGKRKNEELLELIGQVGEALQFAHDQGYVHRDVKPANILLHDKRAYLTDFDLVKGLDTSGGTRTHAAMGSFIYAAPELLGNAQAAGPEVDVFGLAMTTLFALYGEVLPSLAFRDPDPIIQGLRCAEPIKQAIRQALAWQVEHRTSSVAAFCKALKRSELQVEKPDVTSLAKQFGDGWVYLAPGSFTMGDDTSKYSDDTPQHMVRIGQGFWMGRCPVSNLEYQCFLEDGGTTTKAYWSDAGWQWLQLRGQAFDQWFASVKTKYSLLDAACYTPGDSPLYWHDSDLNGDQQPVVGISFYEAEAFCAWLTTRMGPGLVVSLPTEAQWEWAARGRENRPYPWGKQEPDQTRANHNRTIGKTTVPGSYPGGKTPEGLEDMAGNVWEWCQDHWSANAYDQRTAGALDPLSDDPNKRVLRGGAWYNGADFLRAAYRDWNLVWNRNDSIGFRCVLRRLSPEHG